MNSLSALIIFAKTPGKNAKTRLAGHLDERERRALYEQMLNATIGKLGRIEGVDTVIFYTPRRGRSYFARHGLPLAPQCEGDLGERMHAAMDELFRKRYGKVVLVGVDIPGLTPEIVNEAFRLLDDHDVVFGPALDGGYYLVGLRRPEQSIFSGIEWSTVHTLQQSRERSAAHGLSSALTTPLSDIDTIEDLRSVPRDGA